MLLLISPICWASWLNFKLLCSDWRFESFYVNYALSIVVLTLAYGSWTAGSPADFFTAMTSHGWAAILEGIIAGLIWGIGNILLVAAIVLCGLAVGLKIAIGLSLVLGVVLTYTTNPAATNNPWFLAGGVIVVALAILANGTAYKIREEAGTPTQNSFKRGLLNNPVRRMYKSPRKASDTPELKPQSTANTFLPSATFFGIITL